MKLSKKGAALVTGGAKRIGKSIALALAREGYDIALHYNASKKEAEETAGEIRLCHVNCHLLQHDLTDNTQYAPLMDEVFTVFPQTNILINNASIFERGSFLETDEVLFDRHMNINFKAPFFLSQRFAKCCRTGQIINLLDTYIHKNPGAFFVYLLSKKALYSFTRMAARNLGPNIRVNAIAPGTTDISHNFDHEEIKAKEVTLPLKQTVTLEHIVSSLMDVINNDYITGQCIFVDGGSELV